MQRIDYRRVFREAYEAPSDRPAVVPVPPLAYLSLPGDGPAPDSPAFEAAAAALRACDRAIRGQLKRGPMAIDFAPMPLELHVEGESWRARIMQPPVVTEAQAATARGDGAVALERRPDGRAVQRLYLGPFDLAAALADLARYTREQGLVPAPGHELILLNPREADPTRRKVIARLRIVR